MLEQTRPYTIVEPRVGPNGETSYVQVAQGRPQTQGDPAPAPQASASAGPRELPKVEWVDLPEDTEYAGFKVRAWLNYPQRFDKDMASGDADRAAKAAAQILLEHNGWIDQDGTEYPPGGTVEFWDALSNRLAFLIFASMRGKAMSTPPSLDPRKRR